jgi:hypothetical protein
MPCSLDQQIAAVKRELGFRARVYPRFVSGGKMTQAKADFEIAAMKDVLATLEGLLKQERPTLDL